MQTQRRGVLLLTNVYPYDKGEEFLENEIEALCAAFDTVVVAACQAAPDAVVTRPLPANAVALRAGGGRPHGVQGLATMALGAAWLARDCFRALDGPDPRHVAMDAQFEGRARRAARELSQQLATVGLQELDSLVAYAYWLHLPARVGMLLTDELRRRLPGVRIAGLVSRAHRYDLYEQAAPMGHIPLRSTLLAACDAVHPVSDDGTEFLRTAHPRFAAKVSTRRLGTPDPVELVAARREPFHVVSCSFVLPVKRVERFVGVLGLLADRGLDVHWTHFGSGDGLDEVRTLAEQRLGRERVDLPGYVRNVELADRYRGLRPSVFVNLSASEGVPVSIMEAAALGLPVVATDVGGVREVVRDGVSGALLPADFTDEQAAAALERIARCGDEKFAAMCRASRGVWQERFDMAKVYPAFAAELAAR